MAFMDYIQTAVDKVFPQKRGGLPRTSSSRRRQGIGNTGVAEFEDEACIKSYLYLLFFVAICSTSHLRTAPHSVDGYRIIY